MLQRSSRTPARGEVHRAGGGCQAEGQKVAEEQEGGQISPAALHNPTGNDGLETSLDEEQGWPQRFRSR